MNTDLLKYVMIGALVAFGLIIVVYVILSKKMQKSEYKQIQNLQKGTKASNFSLEVLYQKLYVTYIKYHF